VTYRRANKFFSKSADGSGSEELLASVEGNAHIGNWSPDGRFLAYSAIMEGGEDIYVLSRDDKWASRVFLKTPYNERGPMFSPDGRWLAYTSDESGRDEVYVQPFPGPGGRWQVSTQGGSEPMWARDGNQLFYMNGNRLMTAVVKSEPAFAAAQPQLVFDGPYLRAHREHPNYDVSPDGKRFIVVSGKEVGNTPLYVVQDWFGELEQRVRKR
jgi:Tol biopolymer transport system component